MLVASPSSPNNFLRIRVQPGPVVRFCCLQLCPCQTILHLAESDQLPVLATGSRDAFEKLFFLCLDVFSFVAFSSLPCQPPEAVFGCVCCAKHPKRPGPSALCCSSCLRISCSLAHCFPPSLKPSMAWGQEPVPTGSGFPIDANVSGTVT